MKMQGNHSFVYTGAKTKEISFPLGGIGSGCVGLAGNGRLIDWEIYNRPNKGSVNGFSHFAIKAEQNGRVLDARVLNGDLPPPYTGAGSGTGPRREFMAGMPHFEGVEFTGEFPIAKLRYLDADFPADVALTAFNPFIPLESRDSSIPGAFFEFTVRNTLDGDCDYVIAFSLSNPAAADNSVNRYINKNGIHYISLERRSCNPNSVNSGNISMATDAGAKSDDYRVSYQEYWYRGNWFDSLGVYWHDFTQSGDFKNRTYAGDDPAGTGADTAVLAARIKLKPGGNGSVRYALTWHYPNCRNYWSKPARGAEDENSDKSGCGCGTDCGDGNATPVCGEDCGDGTDCGYGADCGCGVDCGDDAEPVGQWKNYYATIYSSSVESAGYALKNWDSLYSETLRFKDALFSSTLPREAIDAVSANISILKSPTCLRLEDGSFYGWEGCHCDSGCCEGSCTHVWNYAYALPFLFPDLERSMRELDYKYNMDENGGMAFRLQLPVGSPRWDFRPCVDGQYGGVIKTYREWKISGDGEWLKKLWPAIKKNITYAWSDKNGDLWDPGKTGVLTGRQHHTLDMELFGPNAWLQGFYTAALKAAAEMAGFLGETRTAEEYMELYENGRRYIKERLFNGEYFMQDIDLTDKSVLTPYEGGQTLVGGGVTEAYWNDEAGELKYQIGEGCGIDQVLAQWHANLCGIGEVFDRKQVRSALMSIYRFNYVRSMRGYANPCRVFCLNGEGGAVMCSFPEGRRKPVIPIPYAEETMYGFEYQVACHMIQEGFIDEGLEIIKSVRGLFDGEKRNPWNEFECGSNYARSMSSYALLNAFSGFNFDMTKKIISFAPPVYPRDLFNVFWCLNTGWGLMELTPSRLKLTVLHGYIELSGLGYPAGDDRCPVPDAELDGDAIPVVTGAGDEIISTGAGLATGFIRFVKNVIIKRDSSITVFFKNCPA